MAWVFISLVALSLAVLEYGAYTQLQTRDAELAASRAEAKHYSDVMVACLNGQPLVLSDSRGPTWMMKCPGVK